MTLKEHILKLARQRRSFTVSDLLPALPRRISRQYASLLLRELVDEGRLVRSGTTRGATYATPSHAVALLPTVRQRLQNKNLHEDEVWDRIRSKGPFIDRLPSNVRQVVSYAFHEMLNNAIEHSKSPVIDVAITKRRGTLEFSVNDYGIGIFRNVMQQRRLESELEAIQDLLKGKVTTQPESHSGQGVFFTSKAADVFTIDSYGRRLTVDNTIPDHFIGRATRSKRGTKVVFRIAEKSVRSLADAFAKFSTDPAAPAFDRSEVRVKLFALGTSHISRSEARRLLVGLEKFRSIILDFKGIPVVGQAFVDEIFRVFRRRHPEVTITPINMNETVAFMVERTRREADEQA